LGASLRVRQLGAGGCGCQCNGTGDHEVIARVVMLRVDALELAAPGMPESHIEGNRPCRPANR
jgi:hypothetical protein